MGKTLGSILAVAAAIAVNVIPGVGQALSAAIGSTLATAVISSVTLYGLQAGVSLIAGGSSQKPDTTETAIKTSRPPRVSAYGTSRLYGAYALYETASNGTACDVYAVHDGQLDGIVARYLGDETVTLTGTVVNQGSDKRYKGGAVGFYTTTGAIPGAGIPAITALVPEWTGRGDGVVLLGVTAKSVKAKDFQETYPSSAVPVPSIVARWQKCPDPADPDPLDEAGWTWTENPVRHLLHYKLVREGPKPALPRSNAGYGAALATLRAAWWARKVAPTLQYWIDAAADCDAPRALKAGGTEPRYRSAVAHKHTDEHKGPVSAILSTFDGWLAPRADGALVVYSGRIYEVDPADLIGSDEIVSYTWEGGPPDDDEAVNEVICSYISAEHDYNMVECDAWRDESDITRRGQVLSSPLETQVPSHAQVRFLAKRLIARKNSPYRGTVTTNIAGRKAQGKRFVPIHLEEAGTVFYSGPAEIIALTRNLRGGVTFQWVAVDPAVDNWNPATEEGNPAAIGNRVAPEPLETPVITSVAEIFDVAGVRLLVTVTAPVRDDLTWFLRWRKVGASVWGAEETFADVPGDSSIELRSGSVEADAEIEVQVAYQGGDGRVSDWSASATVETATTGLVGPATNGEATDGAGEATVSWRNPATPFAFVRIYRGTSNVFGAATAIHDATGGGLYEPQTYVDEGLAVGTYYYWVRPYAPDGVSAAAAIGPFDADVTFGFDWTPTLNNVAQVGNVFTKNAGGTAWNAAVHDAVLRSGDFVVEFTTALGDNLMVGINSDPATDENWTGIDFAIYTNGSTVYKAASGALLAIGTYAGAGDFLRLRKVGTTLTLEKGATVLDTLTIPDVDYALDTSFYEVGKSFTLRRYG